ncbi:MAG: hypothetical protein R2865_07065 [Deinococcales bacterium]
MDRGEIVEVGTEHFYSPQEARTKDFLSNSLKFIFVARRAYLRVKVTTLTRIRLH